MLVLIVKVSTFDDIVFKKDLHIFPWISNIQRITVLNCASRPAVTRCDPVASICGEDWGGGQTPFFDPPFLLRLPSLPLASPPLRNRAL